MKATAYRWGIVALVLWFGGLSCVAGCLAETRAMRAEIAGVAEPDGDGCADGCCSREGQQPSHHEDSGAPHKEMDCCQFLMAPVNVAAKKAEEQPPVVTAPQPMVAEAISAPPADADSSFVSDQSDTHLRCRVLRI